MSKKEFDIIIVGNGGIGCSIAIDCASKMPNATIALIGNKARKGAASLAAGMMLNLFAELEDGCLNSLFYREKFEMGLQAKARWEEWMNKINNQAQTELTIRQGTYVLNNTANTFERDDKTFEYIQKILEEYQTDYELGSPKYMKGYYPEELYRSKQVLYIPDEGSIETESLFAAYDKILQNNPRITLIEDNAQSITIKDNGLKVVQAGNYQVCAPKTVICAGAFSQKLIEQLPLPTGSIPSLYYGSGTGLHVKVEKQLPETVFELPDKVIRTTSRGHSCGVNIVPYDNYRCYVGATSYNLHYEERFSPVSSIYTMLTDLMREFNKKFADAFYQPIIGQRPVSADTYPLIGKTSIDDLWIVSGTKREGFFLSPFLAASLSNEMSGKPSLTPTCFLPERSLIFDLSKEEGIEKAVAQHISYLYHFGLVLPRLGDGLLTSIRENYRRKIEKLYDDLGLTQHGISPELLKLYKQKHIPSQVYS